ncbi:MAG: dipeptide/oligopeptide/nickel ABC transporter ATP-binding protein [Lachnospiraceae bacterium]|nr:dipeptide/oligopeptide/nickel ABC transporter ATP-binding protein [Lachnospiraceae bacterium]
MAENANKTVLELSNIRKTYTSKQKVKTLALDGVNISLYEGEVLGIVGESGSGKTTVGRIMTGILTPDEGRVSLFDTDVTDLKPKKRADEFFHCRMVYQIPQEAFDDKHTIGDGIRDDLKKIKVPGKNLNSKAVELLDVCGLPQEYLEHYPFEMSGGQSVRACIARAIAVEPEILVCDEVTRALDSTEQKNILRLLFTIKNVYRLSMVFISHDLSLVSHFCDRVVVMDKGKVVEVSDAKDIMENPKSEHTKTLIEHTMLVHSENSVIGARGFARAASQAKRDAERKAHSEI